MAEDDMGSDQKALCHLFSHSREGGGESGNAGFTGIEDSVDGHMSERPCGQYFLDLQITSSECHFLMLGWLFGILQLSTLQLQASGCCFFHIVGSKLLLHMS
jgi:hypothetical protein